VWSVIGAIGATTALAAAAHDATGAPMDAAILWRTLDPAVATVEQGSGVVTASSNGEAAIVAEAGGRADTVVVVVAQRPTSIEASALDEELVAIGRATTITALGRDANGYPVPGLAIAFAPLPELGAGQGLLGAAGSAGAASWESGSRQ